MRKVTDIVDRILKCDEPPKLSTPVDNPLPLEQRDIAEFFGLCLPFSQVLTFFLH